MNESVIKQRVDEYSGTSETPSVCLVCAAPRVQGGENWAVCSDKKCLEKLQEVINR